MTEKKPRPVTREDIAAFERALPDLPARERANPPLIEDVLRGIPVSRADRCPRCRQPYPIWDPARTGELCYSCLRAEARSQEAGYPRGRNV